ncbi:MAG: SDR family oxidoreductase [Chloroflexi bacterium]|nr:SDR family oxidoreductase [Chloroflexota bacterium]
MKSIVITGSTRGIGYGLANEFLKRGCQVTVNGRSRPGMSIYGTSKAAVRFLSKSLTKETENTPVKVSAISPGMVITEFITDQYQEDPEGLIEAQRVFNILGDKVETVTPWLVEKLLSNDKSGALFEWLTPFKATLRFLTARFHKRDLFVG